MKDNSQATTESISDSPQTGNDGEVSAVVSNARSVKIQIPVAVYTATNGHGWSKLPISDDDARDLWRKIRRKVKEVVGDELLGEIAYGDFLYGVLYEGGEYAFAFKLQKVENWDQSNRGADYCACAFVPIANFNNVNFSKLLEHKYFSSPSHTPESVIEYDVDDGYSSPTEQEIQDCLQNLYEYDSNRRDEDLDFDWRLIGPMLATCGHQITKWFFSRMESKGDVQSKNEFGEWDNSLFMKPQDNEESISPNLTTVLPSQDEEVYKQSVPDTFDSPFNVSQLAGTQSPMPDGSFNEHLNLEREYLKTENINLKNENQQLNLKLSNLKQSYQDLEQSYQFLENKYRREVAQKNSYIKKMSQPNMLFIAIAFLSGVLVAGIVFSIRSVCYANVKQGDSNMHSPNQNGEHAIDDGDGGNVK